MLADYLTGNVIFLEHANTWEEAIEKAAQPLLDSKSILPSYLEAMIKNVKKNGPYIVILPEIAMPHARNECGSLKTGVTFLLLKNPVMFPEEKPVKILMALSSEDHNGHLEMLGELGSALIEDEIVTALKQAKTEEEVISLIKSAEE